MEQLSVTHVLYLDEKPGSQPLGGAENHCLILLPALVKLGLDVELLVLLRQAGPVLGDAFEKLKASGVKVVILPVPKDVWGINTLSRFQSLRAALRIRKHRVIHVHLDFFIFSVAARMAGCRKVVMSIHNDEKWFGNAFARQWLHWLDITVDQYIAISERVKSHYLANSGINPQKMYLIYYGINVEAVKNEKSSIRNKYGIRSDLFVVGFVGRLVFQKNVELLVEAARFFPDVQFVIAGDGDLRDKLHHMARDLKNVQFLGYQPDGKELISCFDLFCLPSRFEGLGLVLVEAMQQKIPILASRAGAIPEILGNGDYGFLFENDNVNDMVTQLRFILKNPSVVLNKAEQAEQYARTSFDVDRMASQTSAVYLKMIK